MITLTAQDIIDYKPYIKKTANLFANSDRLDDYIVAGITYVDNEMEINGIDLDNTFLVDNKSYENVYLQYITYLYIESCHINNPSKEDLDLIDREYKKYLDFLSKFKIIYENETNETEDEDKNIYNNITLKFG